MGHIGKISVFKYMLIACTMCFVGTFLLNNQAYAQFSAPTDELILAGDADAEALFSQAKQYHDGDGVEQNFSKAFLLYLKAAGMGSNDARINLGYLYFMGEGVEQDYTKARNWYLGPANNGDKVAQENLAMMYELGLGVKKDAAKVKYWREFGTEKPVVMPTFAPTETGNNVFGKPSATPAVSVPKLVVISTQKAEIISPKPSYENSAKTDLRRPIHKTVNENVLNYGVPVWASNLLACVMLALALITGAWFVVQYSKIQTKKKAQIFAEAFYTYHRDQLRINYLRYPIQNRKHAHIDDLWAGVLCTLMVKFAQDKKENTDLLGNQSRIIVQALALGAIKARQAVFPFVDVIQKKILADIRAHDCKPKKVPQHIQVQSVPKTKPVRSKNNIVNLTKIREEKRSSSPAGRVWPDEPVS